MSQFWEHEDCRSCDKLDNMLELRDKQIRDLIDDIQEGRNILDELTFHVRAAWLAECESDMWQAIGKAMDVIDPERKEQK